MRLPPAYEMLRATRVRAAVRRDLVAALGPWLLRARLEPGLAAQPVQGGRGSAYHTVLPGGLRAVVRPYRRGGVLGRVVRETFLGMRFRPLRELCVTVTARGRGLPVPEVLAARVEGGWFGYRGTLVTAEIAGMQPLIEALRGASDASARRVAAARAGEAVGRLHRGGVFHADLNLTNVLVPTGTLSTAAAIVDLDRARLVAGPLSARARRRNLRRLLRSARKLDPGAVLIDNDVRDAFRTGYLGTAGVPCGS